MVSKRKSIDSIEIEAKRVGEQDRGASVEASERNFGL